MKCRSPHGERGLKLKYGSKGEAVKASLPPRGAWIEIVMVLPPFKLSVSLPPRGAWIEIQRV